MSSLLEKYGVRTAGIDQRQGGITALLRHAGMLDTYHREEEKREANRKTAIANGSYSESKDRSHAYRNWMLLVRACNIVNVDPGPFSHVAANDNNHTKALG